MDNINLKGNIVNLRSLTVNDAGEEYMNWLNDPEINQYLESRYSSHSIDDIRKFISSVSTENNAILGMFDLKNNTHIGNIKLGPINTKHQRADIGLLIGNKSYWGKGIATEAIALVTTFAFDELKLAKVTAGCYANNIGSQKSFFKNGFIIEGVQKNHFFYQGKFVDGIMLGKLNESFKLNG